jgi:hypothetical protein
VSSVCDESGDKSRSGKGMIAKLWRYKPTDSENICSKGLRN